MGAACTNAYILIRYFLLPKSIDIFLISPWTNTRDVRNELLISIWRLQISLAQKYSFHALEVLPVARNAKFEPMYPLLEGVTVRWFGHSNKVLMNGRSKCLSGLVFPPSKECFQFRKQKEITWGKVWGIQGWGKTVTFSFFKNAVTIAEVWAGALSCRRRTCLKPVTGRRFW